MKNNIKAYSFSKLKVGMNVYDCVSCNILEITKIDKTTKTIWFLCEETGIADVSDFQTNRFYPLEAIEKLEIVAADDVEPFEETELEILNKRYLAAMNSLAEICITKKQIEAREKEIKANLTEAMEEYGIKSIDNDIVHVTYVAPTTKVTVDSKTLKTELPDVYAKYSKVSNVKGYAKVAVK